MWRSCFHQTSILSLHSYSLRQTGRLVQLERTRFRSTSIGARSKARPKSAKARGALGPPAPLRLRALQVGKVLALVSFRSSRGGRTIWNCGQALHSTASRDWVR